MHDAARKTEETSELIHWEAVEGNAVGAFEGGHASVDALMVHVELDHGAAVVLDNRTDTVEGGKRLAQQLLRWMRDMQREAEAFYEREGTGL
jgi:hypothetical protein